MRPLLSSVLSLETWGLLCICSLSWQLPPFLLFPAASRCFLSLPSRCSYPAALSHLLLHKLCLEGLFDAWTHSPKIRPGEEPGAPDRANPQQHRGASAPAPRPAPLRFPALLWDRGGALSCGVPLGGCSALGPCQELLPAPRGALGGCQGPAPTPNPGSSLETWCSPAPSREGLCPALICKALWLSSCSR